MVIGILVALQIGEWNQRRVDESHLRELLSDVRGDLRPEIVALEWPLLPLPLRGAPWPRMAAGALPDSVRHPPSSTSLPDPDGVVVGLVLIGGQLLHQRAIDRHCIDLVEAGTVGCQQ